MLAHSLAWHFHEPSVEAINNWPAHQFDQWREYGQAIGGLTPLTAEQFVYAIWRAVIWVGSWNNKEPLRFEEMFLPQRNKQQTTGEMMAALKAY